MSLAKVSLDELRARIAPRRRDSFAFSELHSGIPRGALTEVSGPNGGGKTETVLRFIAENPKLHVAWVEEQLTAYPCAFPQKGVTLNRILFAEAGDQVLWTAHQMLRSGIFGVVVVGANRQLEQIELRRLQLAAEQVNTAVVLLNETATLEGAWPIALQVEVQRGNQLRRLK